MQRYNSDLANGLGNLASRTLTMIEKYFDGKVPSPSPEGDGRYDALLHTAIADISDVCGYYDVLNFSRALERIWGLIAEVDKYLVLQQPWALAEDASKRSQLGTILYAAAESLRIACHLAHPVLPDATTKIWKSLGLSGTPSDLQFDARVTQDNWGRLRPGTRVGKPEPVFPRIEKAEALERMEAMESEPQKPVAAPPASGGTVASPSGAAAQTAPDKIAIEEFAKVEMRVGQIKTAERIIGADKLLKLMVDIGSEVRQICAGIAQFYEPEALVGRKVVVVVNLAPRKLRGVESNGMIVAASVGPEGRPVLAAFTEDVEVGARLK